VRDCNIITSRYHPALLEKKEKKVNDVNKIEECSVSLPHIPESKEHFPTQSH